MRVVDPADPSTLEGPWRNRLADAASPYLRQHGHDPVDWWPWCDQAFARAAALDRPVFLSIGYAACHWCHVMARESFSDPRIAALLNQGYVAIKVDREEHPEIDALYMQALLALHGDAGWPASLWLTPDRVPYQGGTYYPPFHRWGTPAFRDVLQRGLEAWRGGRSGVLRATERLRQELVGEGPEPAAGGQEDRLDPVQEGLRRLEADWDPQHAGWGQGAKFPQVPRLELLLELGLARRPALLDRLDQALSAIVNGGLHDHLAGGFHRYTVDADWRVPHFEKMLPDSALLARVLVRAWRVGGRARLLAAAGAALGFMLRDLAAPDGTLMSSLDAEADGREGEPYTWTPAQLAAALGPARAARVGPHLGVVEGGEADLPGSVLRDPGDGGLLSVVRAPLLRARARRPQPAVDDKRIVSWNALAVSALAEAGRLARHRPWVEAAERIGRALLAARLTDGSLPRLVGGRVTGVLEDHAGAVEAMLDLHLATGHAAWLTAAVELGQVLLARFVQDDRLLHGPSDRADLFLRRPPWEDGAEPSPIGLALLVLHRLAALEAPGVHEEQLHALLAGGYGALRRAPHAHPTTLRVLHRLRRPPRTLVLGGAQPHALLAALQPRLLLGVELAVLDGAGGSPALGCLAGKATVGRARGWPCEGAACGLPLTEDAPLLAWVDAQVGTGGR